MDSVETVVGVTPSVVATKVMETAPLVMYFLRRNARRRSKAVSIAQLRVLACLNNCPGSSLSQVAESLGVTNATASALIDRLVRNGLVDRSDDPRERRRVILSLTPAGKEQFLAVRQLGLAEIADLLADLPARKLEQINDGVSVLREVFSHPDSNGRG